MLLYFPTYFSYQDPLAKYRIRYFNDWFEDGFLYHHGHEIIFSLVTCQALATVADWITHQLHSDPTSSRRHLKSRRSQHFNITDRRQLTKYNVSNVKIQVVSFVFIPLFVFLIIPLFKDPILNMKTPSSSASISKFPASPFETITSTSSSYLTAGPNVFQRQNQYLHQPHSSKTSFANAYTPYAGCVCALALGYHLWLMANLCSNVSYLGLSFVLDQAAITIIHCVFLQPFFLACFWKFVLIDTSTFFLHLRWFCLIFPNLVPAFLQCINDALLLSSFFGLRIVYMFYLVLKIIHHCYFHYSQIVAGDDYNLFYMAILCLCVIYIAVLNLYWFKILFKVLACEHFSSQTRISPNAASNNSLPQIHINNEKPENSPEFQHFGSSHDGAVLTSCLYADDNVSDVSSTASS